MWATNATKKKLNESNDIARSQKWPVLESSAFNATIIAHIGQERFGDYSRLKEASSSNQGRVRSEEEKTYPFRRDRQPPFIIRDAPTLKYNLKMGGLLRGLLVTRKFVT